MRNPKDELKTGDSISECLTEAIDCLEEAVSLLASSIAAKIDDNREIPQSSVPIEGEYLIELPLTMVFKTLVYQAFKEKQVNKTQLANQLNLDEKEIRRILDPPRHGTKLATIERVLSALRKK